MEKKKKLACVGKDCVACGCCLLVCPRNAIHIYKGIIAQIDPEACIGCGKCARTCPAAVITMEMQEVEA